MTRHLFRTALALSFAALWTAAPATAQLAAPGESGVAMGHIHLTVRDVEANRRFWTSLGGTPVQNGQLQLIQFPGVFVMLRQGDPTGGSVGTIVNHFGFNVKDMKASKAAWQAAGIKVDPGNRDEQAWIMTPDNARVEILEDKTIAAPMVMHHVHWNTAAIPEMKAWYVKTFGAVPGKRGNFEAADLPGVNLTFAGTETPVVGTRGRALDHVGFEVRNLEAFAKKLEASGVKFDRPYAKLPNSNTAIAFFTDPWGTYIELTENLSPAR
jgi:catechol 2,3-dioxygenase-like lactoylglutathione lyase family enzyme